MGKRISVEDSKHVRGWISQIEEAKALVPALRASRTYGPLGNLSVPGVIRLAVARGLEVLQEELTNDEPKELPRT